LSSVAPVCTNRAAATSLEIRGIPRAFAPDALRVLRGDVDFWQHVTGTRVANLPRLIVFEKIGANRTGKPARGRAWPSLEVNFGSIHFGSPRALSLTK
jgi:hypothetical protein